MITRAEYLKQLKELTDEIRKKDESERSWEDKYYLWHEKVMTSPLDSLMMWEKKENFMMVKV